MKDMNDIIKYIVNYKGEYTKEFLQPEHTKQKSFYNKAYTITINNIKLLYSYNTLVCAIYENCKGIKYMLNDNVKKELLFSNTTLKHIKDFILQNINILRLSNIIDSPISKKDIIKNNNKEF
jgi:hypothetical protein